VDADGCWKVPCGGLPGDGLASFRYGPGSTGGCDASGGGTAPAAHDAQEAAQLPPSHAGAAQLSHAPQPAPPQLPQDEHEGHVGQAGAKQPEVGQVGHMVHVGHAEQAGAAQQAGPQAGSSGA
jgi:hypothetical protein